MRYLLKRPSYKLVLVVNNRGNLEEVAVDGCILPKHEFKAVLKQELSGEPELYEVGGPGFFGTIFNIFADTNLTVTLDDGGHLVSAEAGAADKSLEFVQAVAGLAVSLAKKAVGPFSPGYVTDTDKPLPKCFIRDEAQKTAIKRYAQRHLTLFQRLDILRDALEKSFAELRDAEPTSREETGYAVPSTGYCLFFEADPPEDESTVRINPESGLDIAEECKADFTINLTRRA